jgi:type II secretory pathway pseudopilin PulG
MRHIRHWLTRIFLECFLIIISILAALAVNEWREARERAARTTEARTAFAHEIRSNRDLLLSDLFFPHHKRLQAEYNAAASEGRDDPGALFKSGVHATPLRNAAWRGFSTGTALADFQPEEVLILSDIYREQDSLETLNSTFRGAIGAPRSDRETPAYRRDVTRSIMLYMNDIVPAEERLRGMYDRALDQFERTKTH